MAETSSINRFSSIAVGTGGGVQVQLPPPPIFCHPLPKNKSRQITTYKLVYSNKWILKIRYTNAQDLILLICKWDIKNWGGLAAHIYFCPPPHHKTVPTALHSSFSLEHKRNKLRRILTRLCAMLQTCFATIWHSVLLIPCIQGIDVFIHTSGSKQCLLDILTFHLEF